MIRADAEARLFVSASSDGLILFPTGDSRRVDIERNKRMKGRRGTEGSEGKDQKDMARDRVWL